MRAMPTAKPSSAAVRFSPSTFPVHRTIRTSWATNLSLNDRKHTGGKTGEKRHAPNDGNYFRATVSVRNDSECARTGTTQLRLHLPKRRLILGFLGGQRHGLFQKAWP